VRSIDRLTEEHRGRDIVEKGHGGTIRAALAPASDLHPKAALRFEIDNVSLTPIEHLEQSDPPHAWRVAIVNYMPLA
jgi:broad specificity phosphatase PhoE